MFKGWDFERWVLSLMALLIVGGVGFIIWENRVADTLDEELPRSERDLARIGGLAEEVLALIEEIREDEIAQGNLGPREYIERQMTASRIGKKFNPTPTKVANEAEGYEDTNYRLTPAQPDYDFSRREIANFLLYVEGNTTRMKVTGIRLDLSTRKGAGPDAWKPNFVITNREPVKDS